MKKAGLLFIVFVLCSVAIAQESVPRVSAAEENETSLKSDPHKD